MENDKLNLALDPGSTQVSNSSMFRTYNISEISEGELPLLLTTAENSALEYFPDLSEDDVVHSDSSGNCEEVLMNESDVTSHIKGVQKTPKSSRSTPIDYPEAKGQFVKRLPVEQSVFPSTNEVFASDVSSMSSARSTVYKARFSEESNFDFFQRLGEVPNVEDISLDISLDSIEPISKISRTSMGRFTDPLTGVSLSSSSSDVTDLRVDYEEEIHDSKNEIEEEESTVEFSFKSFDDIYPEDEDVPKTKEALICIEKLFNKSLSELPHQTPLVPQVSSESVHLLSLTIRTFIDELFWKVIKTHDDYQDIGTTETNFDKKALSKHLWDLEYEHYIERKIKIFLNRKATEFFRRKGILRFITPDRGNTDEIQEKYMYTIKNLDKLLCEEKQIDKISQEKIEELTRTVHSQEEEAKEEIQKFEKMVRDTLKCNNNPRLAEVVTRALKSMAKIRSEQRHECSVLVQLQHTLTQLKMKIDELNILGLGLRLPDYENLEYETRALSKKLEDRKNELLKYHGQFQSSVHKMAHFKFFKDTVGERILSQCRYLDSLIEEKDICRKKLHGLKKQHDRMRWEIFDLMSKNGLLSRPVLLRDYDETIKNIEMKRNSVETLRHTKSDIETKLKILQKPSKP